MIESIGIDTTKSALSQADVPQMVSTLREMEAEARSFVDLTIRFLENVRHEFQRRGKDEEFFICARGKFGDLYGLFGEGRPFDFSEYVEWARRHDLLEAGMSCAMESLVEKRTGEPIRPFSAAPLLGGKTSWLNSWKRYRNYHRTITCKKTTSRTGSTARRRRTAAAGCRRALDSGGGMGEPTDPDPEPPSSATWQRASEPTHISIFLKKILNRLQENLTAKARLERIG